MHVHYNTRHLNGPSPVSFRREVVRYLLPPLCLQSGPAHFRSARPSDWGVRSEGFANTRWQLGCSDLWPVTCDLRLRTHKPYSADVKCIPWGPFFDICVNETSNKMNIITCWNVLLETKQYLVMRRFLMFMSYLTFGDVAPIVSFWCLTVMSKNCIFWTCSEKVPSAKWPHRPDENTMFLSKSGLFKWVCYWNIDF